MSLRQVLTIYNAERRLDDDDIAWLDRLRNMTDAERALLIEQLSDKPQKKAGKKSAGGSGADRCIYTFPDSGAKCNLRADKAIHTEKKHPDYHTFYTGKSARASGMAAQLNKSLQQQRKVTEDGEDSNNAICAHCDYGHDHNIHHREDTVGYHPFVSTAQSAEPQSTTDNSATAKAAAGDVHHAANPGD